jgi:type VI secretion system protein ImpF
MAELTPTERLQPCLLDRLMDDEPQLKEESRELRVVSLRRYREGVLRDLSWLLNTGCHPPRDHMDDFPEVPRSVLNYGIPDLSGVTISHISASEIEQQLLRAIRFFEPRISRESLSVRAVRDAEPTDKNAVSFEIEGELWAQPMPDRLYIKTKFDLETGQCEVED